MENKNGKNQERGIGYQIRHNYEELRKELRETMDILEENREWKKREEYFLGQIVKRSGRTRSDYKRARKAKEGFVVIPEGVENVQLPGMSKKPAKKPIMNPDDAADKMYYNKKAQLKQAGGAKTPHLTKEEKIGFITGAAVVAAVATGAGAIAGANSAPVKTNPPAEVQQQTQQNVPTEITNGLFGEITVSPEETQVPDTDEILGAITEFEEQTKTPEIKTPEILEEPEPDLYQSKYNGIPHTFITSDSCYEIAKYVLEETKKDFIAMGSKNMRYDKNGNVMEGEENYYPAWLTPEYLCALALRENSFMTDFINTKNGKPAAIGLMSISPSCLETLEQWHEQVWGETIDLTSKDSKVDLFDPATNMRLCVEYLTYMLKYREFRPNTPEGKDLYDAIGGYSEENQQQVVTASYYWGFLVDDIIKSGDWKDVANGNYVAKILAYQEDFNKQFKNRKTAEPGIERE